MLGNILGPIFNLYLDQFLTYKICNFFVFLFFGCNPYLYSVFSKKAKFKETQERKNDTICEHNCANCSCQNVRFFLHFSFLLFGNFHFFQRCFLMGFRKLKKKKNKIPKQQKQKTTTIENKMQRENK